MRVRFSLLFLAFALSPVVMLAQTAERPFMAGLSANFFDYQGPMTGDYSQLQSYDPGIAFAGYGYINNSLNYSLSTTFAPEVIYPTSENNFISTSMLDVKGMLRWTILNPEKFFVPYIGTGFGLNTASNNLRLYIPASLGMRLRFTENFGLQLESTWQQSLKAGDFQPVSHMVGFVFSLPATRKPIPKRREEAPAKNSVADLPDRDLDGVPDRDDQCPDEKGLHMYLGCPEPETEDNTDTGSPAVVAQEPVITQQPAVVSGTPVVEQQQPQPVSNGFLSPSEESRLPTESTAMVPASALAALNMELQNVYFDNASYELTSEAKSVLDRAAKLLRDNPGLELQVMGHTDESGNERNNIVLSIQRAYKVKYYLVYDKQIPMARISSDGYSSVEPAGSNTTEQGRSLNRRVELQLTNVQTSSTGTSVRGDR